MKILFINSLYYPNIMGGAEKSVQFMAEGLTARGHEAVVVTTAEKDTVDMVNGVRVYYMDCRNLYWMYHAKSEASWKKPLWHLIDSRNFRIRSKLTNILRREKPDIIHSNNLTGISTYAWKLAREQNIPIVHTSRDYHLLCPKSGMFKNGQNCPTQCFPCALYSWPKKRFSQMVSAYVGVSKFIMEKHMSFGYFKNATIKTYIYNPVAKPQSISSKSGTADIITFGYVGALSPDKGVERLIENFQRLNADNARLMIFGKGMTKEFEDYLINRYQSDSIRFMGFKRPNEIYNSIDVSIISSLWHEPFPRILLESYAYGIPVIATDRGGTPEMIEEGKTGYVYNPDSESDLQHKIRAFLDNPEKISQFSKNCLRMSAEFDTDKILGKYIDVYHSVME